MPKQPHISFLFFKPKISALYYEFNTLCKPCILGNNNCFKAWLRLASCLLTNTTLARCNHSSTSHMHAHQRQAALISTGRQASSAREPNLPAFWKPPSNFSTYKFHGFKMYVSYLCDTRTAQNRLWQRLLHWDSPCFVWPTTKISVSWTFCYLLSCNMHVGDCCTEAWHYILLLLHHHGPPACGSSCLSLTDL